MSIAGQKITATEIASRNLKSVSGISLNGQVQENKDAFDKLPEHVATRLNSLIDELLTVGAGAEIKATNPISNAAATIDAIAAAIYAKITNVDNTHDNVKNVDMVDGKHASDFVATGTAILADGTVNMASGYSPSNALSVATKGYADTVAAGKVAGTGVATVVCSSSAAPASGYTNTLYIQYEA